MRPSLIRLKILPGNVSRSWRQTFHNILKMTWKSQKSASIVGSALVGESALVGRPAPVVSPTCIESAIKVGLYSIHLYEIKLSSCCIKFKRQKFYLEWYHYHLHCYRYMNNVSLFMVYQITLSITIYYTLYSIQIAKYRPKCMLYSTSMYTQI